MTPSSRPRLGFALALVLTALAAAPASAQSSAEVRGGDHIVAVVNQELVTAGEVERRVAALRAAAAREGRPRESDEALRKQALEDLVEERVLITHARDAGWRIDDVELDRAVQSVALQNNLTMTQLAERLQLEGLDLPRFRANLRDQIAVERTREREVAARIVIGEDEVERELQQRRERAQLQGDLNLAQILVSVPDRADEAAVAQRRARAEAVLARLNAGEAFEAVAREVSEDVNRERGGEIGARPA